MDAVLNQVDWKVVDWCWLMMCFVAGVIVVEVGCD